MSINQNFGKRTLWLKKENRPLLGHFDFFLPLDLDAFLAFAAMLVSNFCVIKHAYFKFFCDNFHYGFKTGLIHLALTNILTTRSSWDLTVTQQNFQILSQQKRVPQI